MNHEQIQRAISNYLRGELGPEQQRDFLAHINACPQCRSELAIAARLHRELPQATPYGVSIGAALPATLAARVRTSVDGQQRWGKPVGWLDWLFPGAQPNPLRLAVNVLAVFLLLATFAIGVTALRNAFLPGPSRPGYQADFTYATQGLTAIFTDTTVTTDTLTYRWDFGDGSNSSLRNPSHIYGGAGVYNVSMTVSGRRGSDSKSHAVQVGGSLNGTPSPAVSPSFSPTAFPSGPISSTLAPILSPNTPAPPATDTPSLPGQPTPTLPNLNPLSTVPPLSPTQPRTVRQQPSATPAQPNNEPSHTPLPQPSHTPMSEPSNTPLPQPSATALLAPSNTPRPLPTSTTLPQPSSTTLPQPSHTPVIEPSDTPRPQPSDTPIVEPSNTPIIEPSSTPVPPTHVPTHTPQPTDTPTPTHEPQPTNTPAPPTVTPVPPTETPHPQPTWTMVPQPTCTPHPGNDPSYDECHG
ncbi:MAG: hypothetical protein DLM69_06805 [Candidatus Chloroheliales bacterium]|nr:MAG: hypothetical protein DLM69_06805 [Chloroflexota bacterium]